jgi:hypothetical protein
MSRKGKSVEEGKRFIAVPLLHSLGTAAFSCSGFYSSSSLPVPLLHTEIGLRHRHLHMSLPSSRPKTPGPGCLFMFSFLVLIFLVSMGKVNGKTLVGRHRFPFYQGLLKTLSFQTSSHTSL